MHKKLLAVAVAGALAAPAVAMAQSAVTISGALNLWYESAGATGATNATTAASTVSTFDVKSRDRISDGNGSNIRFTATEDLGGGIAGFGQVESAVLTNAQTRNDDLGNPGQATVSPQTASGWATRNSGVGLRGAAWGEVLLGIWDTHYSESYSVDNQLLKGGSHTSSLALLNSFGTAGWAAGTAGGAPGTGSLAGLSIGGRLSNVIRYQSPNWAGFNFRASMARPTDGVVPTTGTVADGKKNRAFNVVPTYSNGPIYASWSWFKDKDAIGTGNTTYGGAAGGAVIAGGAAAPAVYTITSSRPEFAYTFPFGLKLGIILDWSKVEIAANAGAGTELKKTTYALPISWTSGPHAVFFTAAIASKLKGSINGADLSTINITPAGSTSSQSMDSHTGAKFFTLGYQFDISKRTNIHVAYAQIKNDSLAGYDFFSNTVNMGSTNFGADPRIISLGVRHAF